VDARSFYQHSFNAPSISVYLIPPGKEFAGHSSQTPFHCRASQDNYYTIYQ
jgi:hypothetical protein